MTILDKMDSLPTVDLLQNEFLCKLEEVAGIQFVVTIILTEDRSSV